VCDSNVNTISFHSFIVWFYVWAHNASALVTVECAIELAGFGVALTTGDDFEQYFEQEKAYLDGLKTTPPEVTLKIQYVRGLNMLNQIQ